MNGGHGADVIRQLARRLLPSVLAASLLVSIPVGAEGAKNRTGFNPPIEELTLRRGEAYYHLMQAMFAARAGSVREAVSQIRKASKSLPESAELQGEAAQLLLALGQRAEAEKLARDALVIDGN